MATAVAVAKAAADAAAECVQLRGTRKILNIVNGRAFVHFGSFGRFFGHFESIL